MNKVKYLKTIGFNSNQPIGRGFNYPYDIDFSRDGRIFLINRMGGLNSRGIRIQIFTFEDEWQGEFATGPGSEDDQFTVPVCIAINEDDLVYITDEYLNEVKVFDTEGNFIKKWGTSKGKKTGLQGPSGIAHGKDGSVYIAEQYANKVSRYTKDGDLISSWGEKGKAPGQFNLPWGISIDHFGNVYIADWRNDRIQKFDGEGTFIDAYGGPGDEPGKFHRPSSVAVDSNGFIYVADWGNERVQLLDPEGKCQQILKGEATLSKWAEEWLEVNLDEYDLRKESTLLVKDLPKHLQTPYHTASQTEPLFWGAVSVKIDNKDQLFVTEHSRHRIQVYEQY